MANYTVPSYMQDEDVINARAESPEFGGSALTFEIARQDGRTYYRMLINGRGCGSLTTLEGARAVVAYWREKGWAS